MTQARFVKISIWAFAVGATALLVVDILCWSQLPLIAKIVDPSVISLLSGVALWATITQTECRLARAMQNKAWIAALAAFGFGIVEPIFATVIMWLHFQNIFKQPGYIIILLFSMTVISLCGGFFYFLPLFAGIARKNLAN